MLRENSNIVEKCSVLVQKKYNESAQNEVQLKLKQEASVSDPTRPNTFECELPDATDDGSITYTWSIIDVFKGSQMLLQDITEVNNKMTIGPN